MMELKDFNELEQRDFENGAVRDAIRGVFKERDELHEALKAMLSLFENNILVRNTDRDSDYKQFLRGGFPLILALSKTHKVLTKIEGGKPT